jgi:hypothetical protein
MSNPGAIWVADHLPRLLFAPRAAWSRWWLILYIYAFVLAWISALMIDFVVHKRWRSPERADAR